MGDQGRQDLEKAGTPFKKGKQEGRWETMEDDKGRLGKADTPSNTNAYCGETIGDKGRQDLKADTPSNTGTHVGIFSFQRLHGFRQVVTHARS